MSFGSSGNDTPAVTNSARIENDVSPSSFEIACVELLVKILVAYVSKTVETTGPVFDEAIPSKFTESITTVILGCHTKLIEGFRSQINLIAEVFQYLIIDWHHPVGSFSGHYTPFRCGTHNNIVGFYLNMEGNEFIPFSPSLLVDSTKRYM